MHLRRIQTLVPLTLLFVWACGSGTSLPPDSPQRSADVRTTISTKIVRAFRDTTPLPKERVVRASRASESTTVVAVVALPCGPNGTRLAFTAKSSIVDGRLRIDVDHGQRNAAKCGSDYHELTIVTHGAPAAVQNVVVRIYDPTVNGFEPMFRSAIAAN